MRKGRRSPQCEPRAYVLTHRSHFALQQTRNRLRLLAELAEPREPGDTGALFVSAAALADCFDQLVSDLDNVLDATRPAV